MQFYRGVIQDAKDLPDNAQLGDWYIVLNQRGIYIWNGEKWVKVGGGGMNYVQDSLRIDLTDTNGAWDPIKFAYVALDEDYPQTVELIADFVVNAGTVQARAVVYDADDTQLLLGTPTTLLANGTRQTLRWAFDVSELSTPNIIAVQLEVLCDASTDGYHDIVEVRWY